MEQLKASDTPGYTADFISTQMPISPARRQAVLEENDVMERLVLIRRFLDEEIQIGRLEAEINGEVRSRMEKEQRRILPPAENKEHPRPPRRRDFSGCGSGRIQAETRKKRNS